MIPSCLIGGIAALLIPTDSARNGMWIITVQYFGYHAAISIFAMYLLTNKEFELKPHAMFSLARVYETQGKIEQAISEYKNIMNTYSDSDWADLANSRLIVIDTAVVSE